jgi:hypothetical protein
MNFKKINPYLMGVGWGYIHPIYPAFIRLAQLKPDLKILNIIAAVIFCLMGIFVYSLTYNISGLMNYIFMAILIPYVNPLRRSTDTLSLMPLSLSIIMLLIIGVIFPNIDSTRLSFYGAEANFTAFHITVLGLLYIDRGYRRIGYIIMIAGVIATASRSGLVSLIVAFIVVSILPNWRKEMLFWSFILSVASVIIYFYIYPTLLISTGYTDSLSRLLTIFDSSSIERIELNEIWLNAITSNFMNLLTGIPSKDLEGLYENNIVAHNSMIMKTAEIGLLGSLVVLFFGFKLLPFSIFIVVIFFSIFLHGLISLPLFLLISLFARRRCLDKNLPRFTAC